MRRILAVSTVTALAASAALGLTSGSANAVPRGNHSPSAIGHFKHLVVIYEENHSFDNLFGGWGRVNGKSVDGIPNGAVRQHLSNRLRKIIPIGDRSPM